MTLVHVVGARPNFVKMAPVVAALNRRRTFEQVIVHTGQHYDARMSDEILADLDFPEPDHFLGVGSGPHGEQTAKVLTGVRADPARRRPGRVHPARARTGEAGGRRQRAAGPDGVRAGSRARRERRVRPRARSAVVLASCPGDLAGLRSARPRRHHRCRQGGDWIEPGARAARRGSGSAISRDWRRRRAAYRSEELCALRHVRERDRLDRHRGRLARVSPSQAAVPARLRRAGLHQPHLRRPARPGARTPGGHAGPGRRGGRSERPQSRSSTPIPTSKRSRPRRSISCVWARATCASCSTSCASSRAPPASPMVRPLRR